MKNGEMCVGAERLAELEPRLARVLETLKQAPDHVHLNLQARALREAIAELHAVIEIDKELGMTSLRVTVTQEDITSGVPGDNKLCPVARAINRLLPNALVYTLAMFTHGDSTYRIPAAAMKFVNSFDRGELVEPFSFVLERVRWF